MNNIDKAVNETNHENKKNVFFEMLEIHPHIKWLWLNFIYFLISIKEDDAETKKYYNKTLEIYLNHNRKIGKFATLLGETKNDDEQVEKFLLKSLEIKDNDAIFNAIYAVFLYETKNDKEQAEKYFLKAEEILRAYKNSY